MSVDVGDVTKVQAFARKSSSTEEYTKVAEFVKNIEGSFDPVTPSDTGDTVTIDEDKGTVTISSLALSSFGETAGEEFSVKTLCFFGANPIASESEAVYKVFDAGEKNLSVNNGVALFTMLATEDTKVVTCNLPVNIIEANWPAYITNIGNISLNFYKAATEAADGVLTTYPYTVSSIDANGVTFSVTISAEEGEFFYLVTKVEDKKEGVIGCVSNKINVVRAPNGSFAVNNPNSIHNSSKIFITFTA